LVETNGSLIWPLSNPRNAADLFFLFEDDQTCSIVVGEQCLCIEDRKESHDYEMGELQGMVEITILSHRLRRDATHEMAVPSTRIGTRGARIHF
jgi:hypothetical protein